MTEEEKQLIEAQFKKCYSMLYRFAYCAFQDEYLAEEAVQETFYIACKKPTAMANSLDEKNWLFFTLKNVIANMRKIRAHAFDVLSRYLIENGETELPDPGAVNWDGEFYPLSQTQEFQLIKAFAVEKKSVAQLAQERGISISACKKRIERAKVFLQKNIGRTI